MARLFEALEQNKDISDLLPPDSIDIQVLDRSKRSVFTLCAEYVNLDAFEKLLKYVTNIYILNVEDIYRRTPLMCALNPPVTETEENMSIREQMILKMLAKSLVDVTYNDARGRQCLHYAVKNFSVAVVSKLIEAGADVNAADLEGITPLMAALDRNDLDMVRLLLYSGADKTCVDKAVNKSSEAARKMIAEWSALDGRYAIFSAPGERQCVHIRIRTLYSAEQDENKFAHRLNTVQDAVACDPWVLFMVALIIQIYIYNYFFLFFRFRVL